MVKMSFFISCIVAGIDHLTNNEYRSEISPLEGIKMHRVELGPIGRTGDAIKNQPNLNKDIASYIPMIEGLIEAGKLVPNEFQVIGDVGFESVIEAWKEQQKNAGAGAKYLAKLQEA